MGGAWELMEVAINVVLCVADSALDKSDIF